MVEINVKDTPTDNDSNKKIIIILIGDQLGSFPLYFFSLTYYYFYLKCCNYHHVFDLFYIVSNCNGIELVIIS